MGNASSKAKSAASTAAKVSIPTMPTARAPPPPREPTQGSVSGGVKADAERPAFGKDRHIQDDAADPTLGKWLSQLGPVEVPHTGTPFRKDNKMLDILSVRKAEAEQLEQFGSRGRMSARGLSNYLDDRKALATREERAEVARQYGIEPAVLEELAKHYNSPSVGETLRPSGTVEEDKEETYLAQWVDPPTEPKRAIGSA